MCPKQSEEPIENETCLSIFNPLWFVLGDLCTYSWELKEANPIERSKVEDYSYYNDARNDKLII